MSNLADVAAAVEENRGDPRAFFVRGALLPEARAALAENPQHRFRRAKKASRTGKAATLEEVARRWVMIDIDGYPMRDSADLAVDPEEVIESAIRDLLPKCFHDAACFWQLSSSAGFVAGVLKCHLFFWLSEPISNEDFKLYLHVHAPGVDRAPFNAAQPHYIADPVIEGGHDPLPRRAGWIKGMEEEVVLPALDLAQLRASIQQRRERVATGAGLDASAARTVAGALALLGDGEGREGWHNPLRRATLLYARQTPPQNRDDDAVKRVCREGIRAAADREPGQHKAADLARFGSDAYLDALLDGAFAWIEANKREVPEGIAPFHEAPAHSVEDARGAITGQVGNFLAAATAWHNLPEDERIDPPQVGLAVEVGGGKSTVTRTEVSPWSEQQEAARLPHRVLFGVPTVKLGGLAEQAEAHFADMPGRKVAIHRGRNQVDPKKPDQTMCADLDAVKLAVSAGESVETAVCGSGMDGKPSCPFRKGENQCGYYAQQRPVKDADVIIAAHEAIFHLPAGVKKLGLVVMDEAWWQDGVKGGRHVFVDDLLDSVRLFPVLKHTPSGQQIVDREGTDDLLQFREHLEHVLTATPEGYLQAAPLRAIGLTAADCAAAGALEWKRKREGLMRPGMAPEDRRRAAVEAGINAQLVRLTAMWSILEDLLAGEAEATGRAEMAWRQDREGKDRWAICLNTLDKVVAPVLGVPVLLLDATMPVELVRAYLPRLEAAPPVRVKAPFMETRQVRGGWGKTTLLPGRVTIKLDDLGQPKAYAPGDATPRPLPSTLAELRDFVAGETRGEPALVVTYQDAEAAFAGLPGVETAHFNDVAGKDGWKNVRHLFVIGRPRPRSDQVRALAAALTGEPVQVAESHKETRGVRMVDGKSGTAEVRAYANPAAEAVSAAITDAEVIQAVGRARGINRTEANPVRVWIMADVVTPLVVDELLDWRDIAPSVVERMACRGIFLTSPADAAKTYPDLFPSIEAAKKTLQRSGVAKADFGDNPLRISLLRRMSPKSPLRFTYRPSGRGQQTRQGWVRPDMDPEDVWRWLEDRLGELAVFTPDEPEPEPPSPTPPLPSRPEPVEPSGGAAGPAPPPIHVPEAAEAVMADEDGRRDRPVRRQFRPSPSFPTQPPDHATILHDANSSMVAYRYAEIIDWQRSPGGGGG
ncbi:hypothetical protein D9599_25740 [Roseomonas sp. KE2513]|uniref:hypothetical protein n=1 Tax=Roseomonas sp. KE2513 TaxID=2479202 RepID=UPI0018DF0F75|nr:hypothetical protein [Roseomonas sp. KE2513]MBI0538960.1 hypothetical protein [Roseomonas sp. KE2513]